MSAKKGEVIYRRPKVGFEELDPESWTDLALCSAYDKAVQDGQQASGDGSTKFDKLNKKQEHINGFMGKPDNATQQSTAWTRNGDTSDVSGVPNRIKKGDSKKTDSRQNKDELNWKVGDECVALYYEDSLYYDCTIISINNKADTCVVEFTGYGNRETVDLSDLHDPEKWENEKPARVNEHSAKESGTSFSSSSFYTSSCSLSGTDGTSSDVTQNIYKRKQNKRNKFEEKKSQHKKQQSNFHPFQHLGNMAPPSFNTDSLFTMPPPPFMGRNFAPFPSFQSPKLSKLRNLSDDALSSMLMSWYMAGYHTGYYQGLNSKPTKKNKHK